MNREVIRAWDEFDENVYLAALREFKASFAEEREKEKQARLQRKQSECGCWVEPDDTYITLVPPPGLGGLGPNEQQWANSRRSRMGRRLFISTDSTSRLDV